jgi:hypothetical protein
MEGLELGFPRALAAIAPIPCPSALPRHRGQSLGALVAGSQFGFGKSQAGPSFMGGPSSAHERLFIFSIPRMAPYRTSHVLFLDRDVLSQRGSQANRVGRNFKIRPSWAGFFLRDWAWVGPKYTGWLPHSDLLQRK